MALPRPSSPRAVWHDLKAFLATRERHQWVFAIISMLVPVVIVVGFLKDSNTNTMPGPQTIYVENWPADRTDEQIKADQKIHQEQRHAAMKARQEEYQRLADKLGIETN